MKSLLQLDFIRFFVYYEKRLDTANGVCMKKAFTLAELLIVLSVLGILAAITIPTVMNAVPDNNNVRFKKAYYVFEKAVQTLSNDTNLYPEDTVFSSTDMAYFCNNMANVVNTLTLDDGEIANCASSTETLQTAAALNDSVSGGTCADAGSVTPAFITTDGVYWWGLRSTFNPDKTYYTVVCIDVDGEGGEVGIPVGLRYDGRIRLSDRASQYLRGEE